VHLGAGHGLPLRERPGGERYVPEDEGRRGGGAGFAGTPTLADLRAFCRPELKAIQKAGKAPFSAPPGLHLRA